MAGKHCKKTSRPAAVVAMVVAPAGLAVAAIAVGSMSPGVVADTTKAAAPSQSVDLLALITPANSTAQIFAGTTYYGTNYANSTYAPQQVVPFLAGPQGIATAIADANDGPKPDRTLITASGWGAGQTGTALADLAANNPGALSDVDLVILDNNSNRAAGGFWTAYYPFAPLLGTSSNPTPTNLPEGVTVLDVGYEYNINGNAPVDPLNPFALGNSLAAYAYGYGRESSALNITQDQTTGVVTLHDIDTDNDGRLDNSMDLQEGQHYVVKDGKVTIYDAPGTKDNPNNSTIYVTVDSGDLPLTRPLRLLPGGDILADAIDPTMTALVDAGYAGTNGTPDDPAIPKDPTIARPMQPGSSLGALGGVPETVPVGLQSGVDTAQDDLSDPGNLVTKPLGEAGKLPLINGAGLPSLPGMSTTGGNLFTPSAKRRAGATSPGGAKPVKSFTDRVNGAVKKVTGGLGLDKKPAAASNGTP